MQGLLPVVPFVIRPKRRWIKGQEKKQRIHFEIQEEDDQFEIDDSMSEISDVSEPKQPQLTKVKPKSPLDVEEVNDFIVQNQMEVNLDEIDDPLGFNPIQSIRNILSSIADQYRNFFQRQKEGRMHYIIREYEALVKAYDEKIKRELAKELEEEEHAVKQEALQQKRQLQKNNFNWNMKHEAIERFTQNLHKRDEDNYKMAFYCYHLQMWAGSRYSEQQTHLFNKEQEDMIKKEQHEKQHLRNQTLRRIKQDIQLIDEDIEITQEVLQIMRQSGLKEGVNTPLATHEQIEEMRREIQQYTSHSSVDSLSEFVEENDDDDVDDNNKQSGRNGESKGKGGRQGGGGGGGKLRGGQQLANKLRIKTKTTTTIHKDQKNTMENNNNNNQKKNKSVRILSFDSNERGIEGGGREREGEGDRIGNENGNENGNGDSRGRVSDTFASIRLKHNVNFQKIQQLKKNLHLQKNLSASRSSSSSSSSQNREEKEEEKEEEEKERGRKEREQQQPESNTSHNNNHNNNNNHNSNNNKQQLEEDELNPFNQNLSYFKGLTTLQARVIGERGALVLAGEMMRGSFPMLMELDLGNCEIKTRGFNRILQGMKLGNVSGIHKLILKNNQIDSNGLKIFKIFFDTYHIFQELEYLDLRNNEINEEGADVLMKMMISGNFSNLTHLLLSNNYITDLGFSKFVRVLRSMQIKKCPKLILLSLDGNPISGSIKREYSPLPSCINV